MILGTANFGNEYKGLRLDYKASSAILDKARELGIWNLDCARSYGTAEQFIATYCQETGSMFQVYTKGRSRDDYERSRQILGGNLWRWLYHMRGFNQEWFDFPDIIDGVSCYGDEWRAVQKIRPLEILQVPWNIIDRRHTKTVVEAHLQEIKVFARSLFIRGEAFRWPRIAGLHMWMWCLQDLPDFDGIIVGVDTPQQLEEIAKAPKGLKLVYTDKGLVWLID